MEKTMSIHHLKVNGKTVLVNKWGYFFDYLFEDVEEKYFSSLKEVNDDSLKIIKYPSYDEILENMDKIKKSNLIILLYSTQKKEKELLLTYYKLREFGFNLMPFLQFIEADFDSFEQMRMYLDKPLIKYAYLFARLQPILNLNPSKCYDLNEHNYEHIFTKKDFENLDDEFKNAKLYYGKAKGFLNIDILLDLILYDLDNYSNEKITYILKLIKFKDITRINTKELDVEPRIIEKYKKEVAFIHKNGSLCVLGGQGC